MDALSLFDSTMLHEVDLPPSSPLRCAPWYIEQLFSPSEFANANLFHRSSSHIHETRAERMMLGPSHTVNLAYYLSSSLSLSLLFIHAHSLSHSLAHQNEFADYDAHPL